MALRNNVWLVRCELWKQLSPIEICMIDLIITRTIGWRQKEAPIKMDEFVEFSGKRKDHVYKAIRDLIERQAVIKRKENHSLYFSLNEDYFGKLLIKKHEEAYLERRKKISVVVDNSHSGVVVDNSKKETQIQSNLDQNSVQLRPNFGPTWTKIRSKNMNHTTEIIEENTPLKTFFKDISLKTSLKNREKTEESFTLFREPRREPTEKDLEKEIARQLSEARKAGII